MTPPPATSDRTVETPEGIILSIPLADPVARMVAFFIDFLLRLGLGFGFAMILGRLGDFGSGILLVIWFIIWWGYYIVCELLMDGSSPGKAAMKIRVVQDDYTSVNFTSSLIRNLLRVADLMPGFYGLGVVTILFNNNNKRLGDIAAKTIVISTKKQHFRAISLLESALPPTLAFTRAEQLNIIDFARFYEVSSHERAAEIAQPLRETFDENHVDDVVLRLRRYAKWFLGGGK